jgi:bacterioferritin-associated ferredoxin
MSARFTFTWNGKTVPAEPGDNVAEALFRAGTRTIGCSRKRHRPMGLSGSFVQGVLADVDGIPNIRLDQVEAKPGMQVRRQNTWPSPDFDLLKLFRYLPPRWVRGGFEHTRLMPSGTWRFRIWERLLAFLAGEGRLSAEPLAPAIIPGRVITCDLLVVGAGPAGRREANLAAKAGKNVVLVCRGRQPGRFAATQLVALDPIHEAVSLLAGHEVFAVYRQGTLVAAAPIDNGPAVAIHCTSLVLATGKRSCPPVVPGNLLPGVIDAHAALAMATRPEMAKAFGRTIVIGTDRRDEIAQALRARGIDVRATVAIATLRRILGKNGVTAIDTGEVIPCDTVIHAGPWISDPNLPFQAGSDGRLRLGDVKSEPASSPHLRVVGSAATVDEALVFASTTGALADVCPCMDVSAVEITDLLQAGVTHVEELKRKTSCGMGPCQGFPCWDILDVVMRAELGTRHIKDRPSHRAPRRAVTVAQAAGLDGLVEPQQ